VPVCLVNNRIALGQNQASSKKHSSICPY